MIIIEGWVKLEPGEIDRIRDAVVDMMVASRAEPGCRDYTFSIDLADANMLRLAEKWDDGDALAAHFTMPHMAAFNAVLATAKISALCITQYDAQFSRTLMER